MRMILQFSSCSPCAAASLPSEDRRGEALTLSSSMAARESWQMEVKTLVAREAVQKYLMAGRRLLVQSPLDTDTDVEPR